MSPRKPIDLTIDLERGVKPISKASSGLAQIIKQCRATGRPAIVTQKGYPSGVILGIETFTALRQLAERAAAEDEHRAAPPAETVQRLFSPHEADLSTLFVTDSPSTHLVCVRVRNQAGDAMILHLPYRLDSGGRAYTFASRDLPEATVTFTGSEPRRIGSSESNVFAAWCQVADAELVPAAG